MTKIDELMSQLTSTELFALKEALNGTEFIKINDLLLGFLVKKEYGETYGWNDGTGYSKYDITSYSNVILINQTNRTDAFTGRDLEETCSSRVEDMGHDGAITRVCYLKEKPSLDEQAENLKVFYQPVYRKNEMSSLFTTYLKCINNVTVQITDENKSITLPNYQYDLVDGVVKTLTPLNYYRIK